METMETESVSTSKPDAKLLGNNTTYYDDNNKSNKAKSQGTSGGASKKQQLRSLIGVSIILIVIAIIVIFVVFWDDWFESSSSSSSLYPWTLDDVQSNLPTNFTIEVYVSNDNYSSFLHPREIHASYYQNATIVYVGSNPGRYMDKRAFVYALVDYESDGVNDEVFNLYETTQTNEAPTILLNDEEQIIYFADITGDIYKCENVHEQVLAFTDPENDRLEGCEVFMHVPGAGTYHGYQSMAYSDDQNLLCISFGVPCNVCEEDFPYGYILCYDLNETPNPVFEVC